MKEEPQLTTNALSMKLDESISESVNLLYSIFVDHIPVITAIGSSAVSKTCSQDCAFLSFFSVEENSVYSPEELFEPITSSKA